MQYTPLNYEQLNTIAGTYNPAKVKSYNNQTFAFWQRALFQRACSVLTFELPKEWEGSAKALFNYCLFRFGYIAVFRSDGRGITFQSCSLSGYDWYYRPTQAIITNPALHKTLKLTIGKECEILKLCPDYMGIWDIVSYYAEKLSTLDNAINMSIINSKFAYMLFARNKTAAEALKRAYDKINRGEPAVVLDMKLLNDQQDKDVPWQLIESDPRKAFIVNDELQAFETLLNEFDTEIGIPTMSEKRERMITSEAESRVIDSTSRSRVWLDTLQSSIIEIKKLYPDLNLSVKLTYDMPKEKEDEEDHG